MTPFQKLCSLKNFEDHLKESVDIQSFLLIENKHSPNQFMQKLLDAQVKLWDTILEQAA